MKKVEKDGTPMVHSLTVPYWEVQFSIFFDERVGDIRMGIRTEGRGLKKKKFHVIR